MAFKLSSFPIALRIGFGFIIVVGLMSAVTWVGLDALDNTRQALELVVSRDAKNVREAARMVQDIISLQRAEKNLILTKTQKDMDEYEKAISQLESRLRQRLHSLFSSVDEEGAGILNRFRSFFEQYSVTQKEIVALTRKNSNVQARKLSQGEGQRFYEELSFILESLVQDSESNAIKNAQNLANATVIKTEQANQTLESLLYALENIKSMLFEDSPSEAIRRTALIDKAQQNVRDRSVVLEGLVDGTEAEQLVHFKKKWLRYLATSEDILRFAENGLKDKAQSLYRQSGRIQHEIALRSFRKFIKQINLELDQARKRVHAAIEKSQSGNRIIRNISKIHRAEKDLILTLSPSEMQRYSSRISLLRNNLQQGLDKLETIISPTENDIFQKLRKLIDGFLRINQIVVEKSKENANRMAFDLSSGKARQLLDRSEQALQELVAKNDRDMQAALIQADEAFLVSQHIGIGNAIFAVLACIIIAYLTIRFLLSRVEGLVSRANAISAGEVAIEEFQGSRDELSDIDNALTAIADSYGNIAKMAMQVVEGDFSGRLQLRSRQDQMSLAINQIISNMESIIGQAHAISQGLFDIEITPRSDRDRLSRALQNMAQALSSADRANRQQNWEQNILLELGEAMQGQLSITELSNNVLGVLCHRLEAISGLLYLVVEVPDGEVLQLTGSLAISSEVDSQGSFKIGEGLVGQAILNREPVVIRGVAGSFTPIACGLGSLVPDSLVFAPFFYEGNHRGVVALAFISHPEEQKISFISKVMETIAITFETAQARPLTEALNESRKLTAKLQETNAELTRQSMALERAKQVLEERNTTLQKAQQELTAQAEQLKRSDQYKSDFLATMSHEIRTPMNGILGTAQLLEQTQPTSSQQKLINTIAKSGYGLLTLIDDILDLSKIEAGKLELDSYSFYLEEIIDNVKNLLESRVAEKRLQFNVKIDPLLPTVLQGDPARLRQILLNLVGNAVKFTERGSVSILAAADTGANGKQLLHISIQDTGIGISPEVRHLLFKPFSQGDASITRHYGGTGLGLAVCKRLVDAMGGEIGIESQEGVGSSFWIQIPLVEGSLEELSPAVAPIRILEQQLSVLLVEDEETNQEVALGMLEQLGCSPSLATGGQQAIEAIAAGKFDLVFMDVQMPGMDGLETTRRIRSLNDPKKAALPIIAMTAYAMQEDADQCYEAGMDGFIPKPILMGKIAEILHSVTMGKISNHQEQKVDDFDAVSESIKILDTRKLDGMRSDLSAERCGKIMQACLTSISQYCQLFETAFAKNDSAQMARQVHKLKGSAGSCGLDMLHNFLVDLEKSTQIVAGRANPELPVQLRELVAKSATELIEWATAAGMQIASGGGELE